MDNAHLNRRQLATGVCAAALAVLPGSQLLAQQATTTIAGRRIVYDVAGYRIRMEFLGETQLRWTYLAAPTPADVGKTATETCDRMDLRSELVLMAWTEADKTHVFDVFDFVDNKVFGNFVWPDGKRAKAEASFVREN
jgi:hypothetical protein